jgi:hypothetical protein
LGATLVVTSNVVVLVLGVTGSVVVLVPVVVVVLVLVVVVCALHTPPSEQKPSRQTHMLLVHSAFLLPSQPNTSQVPPVFCSHKASLVAKGSSCTNDFTQSWTFAGLWQALKPACADGQGKDFPAVALMPGQHWSPAQSPSDPGQAT